MFHSSHGLAPPPSHGNAQKQPNHWHPHSLSATQRRSDKGSIGKKMVCLLILLFFRGFVLFCPFLKKCVLRIADGLLYFWTFLELPKKYQIWPVGALIFHKQTFKITEKPNAYKILFLRMTTFQKSNFPKTESTGHQYSENTFQLFIFKFWWVQKQVVSPSVLNKNGKVRWWNLN